MSSDDKGVKRFNGEDDDPGKQLKKWTAWAKAKMFTMKDLSAKQRGPWLFTLLEGKALEAVEHLEFEDLSKEEGEQALWNALKKRFPEKEPHDQMGEALGEVFGLCAHDGETSQQWTARVQEVFLKCTRKASVSFPAEAQGWIALHCAGFNEEQKAIIKAKAQGKLDIEQISAAMRSCFPAYKASSRARKPMSALVVEQQDDGETSRDDGADAFEDIEAFLADYDLSVNPSGEEILEQDAAEALAVTWKERRKELSQLQRSRKFNAADQARKSFRVEIEELKRRTKCRRCGKTGHWARECRLPPQPGFRSTSSASAMSSARGQGVQNTTEANFVEHQGNPREVAMVTAEGATEDHEIRFVGTAEVTCLQVGQADREAPGLVSSPGFGVIDSGCGRTLIGEDTLKILTEKLAQITRRPVETYETTNVFRFGNGATETSSIAVRLPVGIGGQVGLIDAAIIRGQAPLLLGRPTLEKLRVKLNFKDHTMHVLDQKEPVPMDTNRAGQLLVDVMNFPAPRLNPNLPQSGCRLVPPKLTPEHCPQTDIGNRKADLQQAEDSKAVQASSTGTRELGVVSSGRASNSEQIREDRSRIVPDPPEPHPEQPSKKQRKLKAKQCRCLLAQLRNLSSAQANDRPSTAVVELFSPPRFTAEARRQGLTGLAFDKVQGCDLLDKDTQLEVSHLIDNAQPELLTACPPCTYWGGWDNLNRCFRTPLENARLVREARAQVRFCVEQMHAQLRRGGHFLFEHPLGSRVWKLPEMQSLIRKFGFHRVHMCAYGLKCPRTQLPERKSTGLVCSNPAIVKALRTCPGCPKHQVLQGNLPSGQPRTSVAASYAPEFVRSVWKAIGPAPVQEFCKPGEPVDFEALQCECLAAPAAPAAAAASDADPEAPVREEQAPDPRTMQALKKLHANLGHPSTKELVRVLRHSGASEEAVRLAGQLQCSVCANNQRPSPPPPANASVAKEFNEQVGLDIKYLPSWEPTKKIPCVNIVDYATSLQIMIPLPKVETGDLIVAALRDRWIAWAGPPQRLVLDPSQPNLSEVLGAFCNNAGVDMRHTAAEAAWQIGKVERHGQWFERIFKRVCDECHPASDAEFQMCLQQTQSAKNSLLTETGASPYQLVFGRNPRVPTDLMQEQPHLPAVDAAEFESVWSRSNAVRMSARKAVLEVHDDRALKAALRARPRVTRPFRSGDCVYYWRTQKSIGGTRIEGGRWYGAALVLGNLGRNLVVAHRRSIMRCSPEQLRFATAEEAVVAEFPDSELLGIRTLLEKGQFPKSQFLDLTQEGRPPEPEAASPEESSPTALNAAEFLRNSRQQERPPRPVPTEPVSAPTSASAPVESGPSSRPYPENPDTSVRTPDIGYGPVRRLSSKTPSHFVYRPPDSHPDDFLELMSEVVPRFVAQLPEPASSSLPASAEAAESPRPTAAKREASREPSLEPDSARPRLHSTEVLFCEQTLSCATSYNSHVEALMAAFLQKRAQKELPAVNNPPELQSRVDEAKTVEWETLQGKQAIRIHSGKAAADIRRHYSHRFIGSRFVVTNKKDEEGERVKARWCLQGHNDPDFHAKVLSGECHSPTLSPLARALILQMLASNRWTLNLGDIKGAFLEAGPLPQKYKPLYAHQPPGGVPGLAPEDVVEIIGNVYGANNAPAQWYQEFDAQARKAGFTRSAFDACLYLFREPSGQVTGIMGAHVDDTITGGQGKPYLDAIAQLRSRFPYRKWRTGSGEFCGVMYTQDPSSYEISYDQREYAKHIRPIGLSKERQRQKEDFATERELSALRAVNGAMNWLFCQSRPDLCVHASFAQQAFPRPKVRDLLYTNQGVRRARQHADVGITVKSIPWDQLSIVFHSDAGFGNASGNKTQAGYVVAFTDRNLEKGLPAQWSPITWKSYKMSRVVASTLAGETQSFVTASGVAEWLSLMIAEVNNPNFDIRDCAEYLRSTPITGITDCKSLYDAIHSPSSPGKAEDKRVSIDLTIIKQCIDRTGLSTRWAPTELMIADGLTKDQADPSDLLRAALQLGSYQLSEEARAEESIPQP